MSVNNAGKGVMAKRQGGKLNLYANIRGGPHIPAFCVDMKRMTAMPWNESFEGCDLERRQLRQEDRPVSAFVTEAWIGTGLHPDTCFKKYWIVVNVSAIGWTFFLANRKSPTQLLVILVISIIVLNLALFIGLKLRSRGQPQ